MSVQSYKLLLVTYAFIIQQVNLHLYKIIVKFEVGKHFGRLAQPSLPTSK